jgi:hypothetical protein
MQGAEPLKNVSEQHSVETKPNSTQAQANAELSNSVNKTQSWSISNVTTATENTSHTQRRLLQTADKSDHTENSKTHESDSEAIGAANVENNEALEDDADSSFNLLRDVEDLPDEYGYDYDDYVDDTMWGDEEWKEQIHEKTEDYVSIDAHILSTPVSEPFVLFLCFYICSSNGLECMRRCYFYRSLQISTKMVCKRW